MVDREQLFGYTEDDITPNIAQHIDILTTNEQTIAPQQNNPGEEPPLIVPIDVDQFIVQNNIRRVTTARLFIREGKNPIPDPNGLYSPEIFGVPENEKEYRTRFGYIQLPIHVIHPVFIDLVYFKTATFIDFFRVQPSVIVVSKDGHELIFIDEPTDETLRAYRNTDKYLIIDNPNLLLKTEVQLLIFKAKANQGSKTYQKLINVIQRYGPKLMFTNKLLVIPAAFRHYSVAPDGKIQVDELTDKYATVIQYSENFSPSKQNTFKLLKALNETIQHLKDKFTGKEGALRQKIASKRVNFSGRSVIVPDPTLEVDQLGIPFKMAIELYLPEIMHRLLRYHAKELDELNIKRTVVEVQKLLRKIARGYYLKPGWHEQVVELIAKVIREEVFPNAVVVFKRDPSIWKASWLAARPVLNRDLDDDAIHLHPLYCAPLGGDFDGDTVQSKVKLRVHLKQGTVADICIPLKQLPSVEL